MILKNLFLVNIFIILIIENVLGINSSQPLSLYSNFVDLVPNQFRFYWNYTSTHLNGEIHCKTNGWVGFGFSPDGKMGRSDIVVGWFDSQNRPVFKDAFTFQRLVYIDANQDWELKGSSNTNGIKVFQFTRRLQLCDGRDRSIGVIHLTHVLPTCLFKIFF